MISYTLEPHFLEALPTESFLLGVVSMFVTEGHVLPPYLKSVSLSWFSMLSEEKEDILITFELVDIPNTCF